MNIAPQMNSSLPNRNISSLLSQIQDDGPAFSGSMNQDSINQAAVRNFSTDKVQHSDTAVINTESRKTGNEDVVSISSNARQKEVQKTKNTVKVAKNNSAGLNSKGVWIQSLFFLISAALLATTLYHLNSQTADIEKSLSDYDSKMQQNMIANSEPLPDSTKKINETLQALQTQLLAVKTDYSTLDKKYNELKSDKLNVAKSNEMAQQKNASHSKHEILPLQKELHSVKNKLSKKNTINTTTKSNNIIVNLASLSNKVKAEKIVQQLYTEGLLPAIEPAIVKGERVYRLSVSGFTDRKEAELFIHKAGKQYGMNGSRIRKSQG